MSQEMNQQAAETGAAGQAPPDRVAAVFKLVVGLAFGAASIYFYTVHAGHTSVEPSAGAGVVTGIAAGLCVWLVMAGAAQFGGGRVGWPVGVGALVVCAVAGGMIEPRVLAAKRISDEQTAWERLQGSPKRFEDFERYKYSTQTPRKGFKGGWAMAQARSEIERLEKLKSYRVETLRRLIQQYRNMADPGGMDEVKPAIDLVKQALSAEYARALDELNRKSAEGKTEFAVDPAMRAALAKLFEWLAKADDDAVTLLFTTDTQLAPAAGAAAEETIPPGDAFAKEREGRRWRVFENAMENAFKSAFGEAVLQLRTADTAPPGKPVFEVKCAARRAPGGFTLTRKEKAAGNLFNMEVAWEFAIKDADGKELCRNRSRSNPAESLKFNTKVSDPDWAAYSVMMDSAYFNYGREVIGRLGMTPPPVRGYFVFEK